MKVLITGATGFIGSHVARRLAGRGFEINALVRKTSNKLNIQGLPLNVIYGELEELNSVRRAMKGCSGVFHIAASYGFWAIDPGQFYRSNVEGTKNIMRAAMEAGVEKIIYTSSESTLKIDSSKNGGEMELDSLENLPGSYKRSKLLAEIEVLKSIDKGLPVIIVSPTAPIGSRDVKPTPTGKIVLDMLNRKMPAYVNTGLNIIDVEDVAEGHILAFEKGQAGRRYLLGNKNLTLKEILDIIGSISGIKPPKVQIPLWLAKYASYVDEFVTGKLIKKHPRIPLAAVKTAYKFRHFDCSKTVSELGLPQNPVEDAFERSINWFRENDYVKN